MTSFEWCTIRCGGKCCVARTVDEGNVTCPKLAKDKSCSVYQKRYYSGAPDLVVVGYYKSKVYKDLQKKPALRPFYCGKIENILRGKALPPEVEAQCCYAHPELLENYE